MARDPELQSIYDDINKRGWFKTDPDFQAIGKDLRSHGWVVDPTQGGLAKPAVTRPAYTGVSAIKGLEPELAKRVSRAQQRLAGMGVTLDLSDKTYGGVRTREQQAELRRRFVEGKGALAAAPGFGPHEFGRALDLRAAGGGVSGGIRDERVRKILQEEGLRSHIHNEPWHWEADPAYGKPRAAAPVVAKRPTPAPAASPRNRKEALAARNAAMIRELADPSRPENRALPGQLDGPNTGLLGFLNRAASIIEKTPIGEFLHQQAEVSRATSETVGRVQKASTNAANALAREIAKPGDRPIAALRAGYQAGREAILNPNAPTEKPAAVSTLLGVTPESSPIVRWPAKIADFVVSIRTDPANRLVDPALAMGGRLAKPLVTRGAAAVGAKTAATAARVAQVPAVQAVGKGAEKVFGVLTVPGGAKATHDFAKRTFAYAGLGPNAKQAAPDAREGLNAARGIFKGWMGLVGTGKGFLVANPATQTGNVIGNHLMAKLALDNEGLGSRLLSRYLPEAAAEVATSAKGTPSAAIRELAQHSNAFSQTFAGSAGVPVGAKSLGGLAATGLRKAMGVQDYAEKTYKLGLYKSLRAAGKAPADAAKLVDRYLFDYSDRSALVEVLDRVGPAPFATFGAKAFKAFVGGVAHRPDLMRRYLQARERMFADPKDRAAYEQLPEYERGLFTLPLGDGEFLNLNRYNPFGGALNTLEAARQFAKTGKPPVPSLLELASKPLPAQGAANVFFNRKLRGENVEKLQKIVEPGAPPGIPDDIVPHLRELARNYAPSGRGILNIIEAIEGIPASDFKRAGAKTPLEAVLQSVVGLRATKAETLAESKKRTGPEIAERRKVTGPFYRAAVKRVGPIATNPYRRDAEQLSAADVKAQAGLTRRYIELLKTSPRVVNVRGELTRDGRERLERAAQYLAALEWRKGASKQTAPGGR